MARVNGPKGLKAVRLRGAALLVTTAIVAGCAIPDVPIYANDPNFEVAAQWDAHRAANPGMVDDGWIHSFNDPRLVELVTEALNNNRDLRVASARLQEVRAIATQAGAPLLPTVDFTANANRSDTLADGTTKTDSGSLGFDVSWEADVWGRIRSARAAAALDAVAQSATFEGVRISIAAAVANAYFTAIGNAELLAVNQSELRVQRNALRLVQERVDAGQVLSVDANIARANVANAEAQVISAEGDLVESIRTLEVLLGQYPDADLTTHGHLHGIPGAVPKGLPSQLLERRPDLVAADRAVAAAFFRTESAKAARLPSFSLSGDLTGSGQSLGDALESGNIAWTLIGNAFAPVFNGGSRKLDVEIANARQEQALETFAQTALEAFLEVENALTNEQVLARQASAISTVVEQRRQALDIEQQRYDAGEIDIDRVDDTRLAFFAARRALVQIRIAQMQQRVGLHVALGGSFDYMPDETPAGG